MSRRFEIARLSVQLPFLGSIAIDLLPGLIATGFGRWVRLLRKRYNEQGPDSLGDRRQGNGSAPAILTPEALSSLKERLKTPPDDGGLWTGPKVARWLASFHSLKAVHDQRGWDALIAIEYSIQKPRPRHPNAAGEEDREALKKTARRRR